MKQTFDFYGLRLQVQSTDEKLIEEVRRDFAYFAGASGACEVSVTLHLAPPPYQDLPSLPASFFTPRNVCYRHGDVTYIDYFGKGLSIFHRRNHTCTIYGEDVDLVHEICYLFILSTCGRYLDKRGVHRIHALAVSRGKSGALLLLPSGGGKSTVALRLLSQPGFWLLSEDTPLVNRRGEILPFPLRVGVRPESDHGIPEKYVRTMKRMEFDPKTLIDIEVFRDRLGEKVAGKILLVGERNLGSVSGIVSIPRRRALNALVKYMVVGLGVYQGLEFLLERGPGEVFGQFSLVFSRLRNALVLLSRSSCYLFTMGRDIEQNCKHLIGFLDANLPSS